MEIAIIEQSTATVGTSEPTISQQSSRIDSQGELTTKEMITSDDSASPVIPHQSLRLSRPLERYSPGIFFKDSGEPST